MSHKKHFLMGKSKDLSQDLSIVIVAKHTDGIGYKRISECSSEQCWAIIWKWKEHHFIINRPRCGLSTLSGTRLLERPEAAGLNSSLSFKKHFS